jgi:ribulose-phosphate 3-epimerase
MVEPSPIRIAPSLLAADFGRLGEDIARVEGGGADLLHLDVMDGHFVPNLSFGVPVVQAIGKRATRPLDTHLMITDPGKYAEPFAKAGSHLITFHIEVVSDAPAMVRHIRSLGVQVGVALNPATPAAAIDAIVEDVDLVLVMTVWPGFGGQKFIAECVPKIGTLARRLRPGQMLEVDGGINRETTAIVAAAGANTLVAGSAIYNAADPVAEVGKLRAIAEQAAGRSRR